MAELERKVQLQKQALAVSAAREEGVKKEEREKAKREADERARKDEESAKRVAKQAVAQAVKTAAEAKYKEIAHAQAELVPEGASSRFNPKPPTPLEEADTLGDLALQTNVVNGFMRRFKVGKKVEPSKELSDDALKKASVS